MQTSPSIVLASRRFDAPRRFPWGDPPAGVTLTHDDVHVWRVALVDLLEIAERFFSPREAAALRGRSPSAQTRAFFHCWTRKEAYLKARGMGVTWPLDRVEVSVSPGRAALLNVCDDPAELSR